MSYWDISDSPHVDCKWSQEKLLLPVGFCRDTVSCFERRPNDVSNDVKGYQNPDLWIHLLSCSFHSPFISSHFLSLSFHAIMKTWYRHNLNTKSHKVAGNAKPTKKSKTEKKTNLLDTSWTQHWSTLEVACAQLGRSFHWNRSTLTTQSSDRSYHVYVYIYTLWLFNVAMENHHFE